MLGLLNYLQTEEKPRYDSVINGHTVSNGYHKKQAADYYINASTDLHIRTAAMKSVPSENNEFQ